MKEDAGMEDLNRFTPPTAAVADLDARSSRAPLIALALVGALDLACIFGRLPGLLRLVRANAMNPITGLAIVLGAVCLAIGLWRAFRGGARGRKSFALAIVLFALALWRGALFAPVLFYAPFALAIALALAGLVLVQLRLRATGSAS